MHCERWCTITCCTWLHSAFLNLLNLCCGNALCERWCTLVDRCKCCSIAANAEMHRQKFRHQIVFVFRGTTALLGLSVKVQVCRCKTKGQECCIWLHQAWIIQYAVDKHNPVLMATQMGSTRENQSRIHLAVHDSF